MRVAPRSLAGGRSARRRAAVALPVAALLLAGCASNTRQTSVDEGVNPQDYLDPVGRFAVQTDQLWDVVLWVAIAIFVLVYGLIVVAILRFRERPGDDRLPKQIHGNPRLEAVWTVIPALILAGVAVPTVRTLFELAEEPEGALVIDVTGKQWWWEYEYEGFEGLVTANILHVPTEREIVLRVTSTDVIHSFWVPKLAGKQDAVPGRTNIIRLFADEPGEFLGQCAEYCGLSHANMRLRVIAEPRADFEEWARQQAQPIEIDTADPEVARGAELFATRGCVGCHSIRGYQLDVRGETVTAEARIGPDLTYFDDRGWFAGAIFENTDENLAAWLRDPPGMKPMQPGSVAGMPNLGLTEDEVDALVAFLRTLDSGSEEAR